MNKRRRLNGTVKSNKMDKTIIVDVVRTFAHPLYHKVVREKKSYKAHDPFGCNVGDKVVIVESKPISRTVRWVVEKILVEEIRQEGLETVEEMEEAIVEAIEETEEELETVAEELAEAVEDVIEEAEEEEQK
ncbi:MAG: 30S ribosomal protein S17 [Chloroflexi bacterium]|jgi:small subunit ribosomal protein S17|nr:30S ribosomal protein S17 [Chloroflexota bacterium]